MGFSQTSAHSLYEPAELSINNPEPSGADNPSQRTAESGSWRPFPDFLLLGHINLHKSPVCAATLARHISKQYEFLRVNRNGIISSHQLEINRNPDAYGGLRNGKPLSVSEWKHLQKERAGNLPNPSAGSGEGTTPNGGGFDEKSRYRGRNRGRGREVLDAKATVVAPTLISTRL